MVREIERVMLISDVGGYLRIVMRELPGTRNGFIDVYSYMHVYICTHLFCCTYKVSTLSFLYIIHEFYKTSSEKKILFWSL